MTLISFKKLILASAFGLATAIIIPSTSWSSGESVFGDKDKEQTNHSSQSQANIGLDIEAQSLASNVKPPVINNAADSVVDEEKPVPVSRPYDGYFGWLWGYRRINEKIPRKNVEAYLSKYPGSSKDTYTETVVETADSSDNKSDNKIVEGTENLDNLCDQHPVTAEIRYLKNSQGQKSVCLYEDPSNLASLLNQNEDTADLNSMNQQHINNVKLFKPHHEPDHASLDSPFRALYVNSMNTANADHIAQQYIEWHNPTHPAVPAVIFNNQTFNLDQRLFDLAFAQASKLDKDDAPVAKPAVELVDLSKLTGKQLRDAMLIHNLKNSENGQNPNENSLTVSTVYTALNQQDFNRVIDQWIVFREFPDGETPLEIGKTVSGHKILIYKSYVYSIFFKDAKLRDFNIIKLNGDDLMSVIATRTLDIEKLDIYSVRNSKNVLVYTSKAD